MSLLPAFRGRHYSELYKAIRYFPLTDEQMMPLFAAILPLPQQRPFRLLGVDTVPHPRPYAPCLDDRGFIYSPNPVPGQKPVAIGHTDSLLAFLPEPEGVKPIPWAVFLSAQRVVTHQNAAQVAQAQVSRWLQAQSQTVLPFPPEQTLIAADSRYSTPEFLYPLVGNSRTNVLVRLRSNRVVWGPPPEEEPSGRGHPPLPKFGLFGEVGQLFTVASHPEAKVEGGGNRRRRRGRDVLTPPPAPSLKFGLFEASRATVHSCPTPRSPD